MSQEQLNERIRRRYFGLARRADSGSRQAAIHLFCLECMGGSSAEARACEVSDCPVWPFRPGDTFPRRAQAAKNGGLSAPESTIAKSRGQGSHPGDRPFWGSEPAKNHGSTERLIHKLRRQCPGLARRRDNGSRQAAIHLYCLECLGGSQAEVRACTVPYCALWLYRPGETFRARARAREKSVVHVPESTISPAVGVQYPGDSSALRDRETRSGEATT